MTTSTPSRSGISPSSSPRLPSPPPFTEVQFGPKSPSIGGSISELQLEAGANHDDGGSRRIRPGTKGEDIAKGPPFVPLHQLESPFQLQEYLKSLYHKLTRDETNNLVRPVNKEMALELATPPTAADSGESVDRNLWLYELCRFLCSKTTRMIVAFFADNPPCSSITCPEMRASEWQYLCAVHEPPKSCCAIDYCNHTLDWASNVLTSTKHFPSRLSLGGEGANAHQSMRQLTNIFRRVYRIYAHAWFQHRELFWAIEAELGLYVFFKTVCDVYQLIPDDNYTIPPEAEGERDDNLQTPVSTQSPQRVAILQKATEQPSAELPRSPASTTLTTGATTRRHKHTPSTGVPVAVIAEGAEEDEETSRAAGTDARKPRSPTKKPDLERLNSPKHIDLPQRNESVIAPEDPTPVANREVNPFVLSSDAGDATGERSGDTPPAAANASLPTTKPTIPSSEEQTPHESQSAETSSTENTSIMTTGNETLEASETTLKEEDKSSIAAEKEVDEQGNEIMERIEPPSSSSTAITATTAATAPPPVVGDKDIVHESEEVEEQTAKLEHADGSSVDHSAETAQSSDV